MGATLLILGAFCDAADGAVARGRAMASDAGEVLDAAVDRWGEMAVFFGFAWYYRSLWLGFLLAVAACAGAVMVSYTRAKAEGYGIDAGRGLMQRHERAVWLCVATLGSSFWEAWHPTAAGALALHTPVLVALGVIAVLGNWTGWLRMQLTRQELRRRERRDG
jgi:CDP-diacylglycerol--glycerol-3-phosphate 3-phosphatidyltransferase